MATTHVGALCSDTPSEDPYQLASRIRRKSRSPCSRFSAIAVPAGIIESVGDILVDTIKGWEIFDLGQLVLGE